MGNPPSMRGAINFGAILVYSTCNVLRRSGYSINEAIEAIGDAVNAVKSWEFNGRFKISKEVCLDSISPFSCHAVVVFLSRNSERRFLYNYKPVSSIKFT